MRVSFLLAFLTILTLPLLQMGVGLVEPERLKGAVLRAEFPELSTESFWKAEYQQRFASWFEANFGFRGHLIKTDNQINFSLFKEISATKQSSMIVGEDNFLFEKTYVDDLKRRKILPASYHETMGRGLRELQDLLKQEGIVLLVLISPSKAEFYREKLPSELQGRKDIPANYHAFLASLKKHGVNTFDSMAFFEKLAKEVDYPLFPRSGTHWSSWAACKVSASLLEQMEPLLEKELNELDCTPKAVDPMPRGADRDLADLTNLWWPEVFYGDNYYPSLKQKRKYPIDEQPRMLFLGSSFLWGPLRYFDIAGAYSRRNMFYYYKTNHPFVVKKGRERRTRPYPIKRLEMDWQEEVFSYDVIVIEANVTQLDTLGFGFTADALIRLREKLG